MLGVATLLPQRAEMDLYTFEQSTRPTSEGIPPVATIQVDGHRSMGVDIGSSHEAPPVQVPVQGSRREQQKG